MGKPSHLTPFRIASRLLLALTLVLPVARTLAQSANTPLLLPSSVTSDSAGNLYFAETAKHLVRRFTPAGVLSTIAGTGTQGYAGDSGPATAALLDSPTALAIDASGDVFIADSHNHRIRRIDALTGSISTYAMATLPTALTFNPQGWLLYADASIHQVLAIDPASGQVKLIAGNGIQGFSGDGRLATAASIDTPSGLAFDLAGNLHIADAHNHRVRRVDASTGIMTTVAGTGVPGFSGDRTLSTGAQLDLPRGLILDASGDLFIADSRNQRIRKIDASTGIISTIAGDGTQAFRGDGSPAVSASLDTPRAVTLSAFALPVLADSANNRIREVKSDATIQTIAGAGAVSPARQLSVTTLTQTNSTTLTATVTAATGIPTGSATLIDGTTPIATTALSSSSAEFPIATLSSGSHTLTAAYSGSSSLLPSTSLPLLLTIGSAASADFALTASTPTTVTAPAGTAATFTFAIALTGPALTSPIDLSLAGAPSGAMSSFNPAQIPPPAGPTAFTLTVVTPVSAHLDKEKSRELETAIILCSLLPVALRRRRRASALCLLMLLTGCGARVNTGDAGSRPPLSYNLTVTANATSPTGTTLLHTAQVTLIVD
jgi:streptogramin lyase